jgi:hypothetical protein
MRKRAVKMIFTAARMEHGRLAWKEEDVFVDGEFPDG